MTDISVLEAMDCWEKVPDELKEKVKQRAGLKVGDTDLNGNIVSVPKNSFEWFKDDDEKKWWGEYCEDRMNEPHLDIMKELFERGATKEQALKSIQDLKQKAIK
tara:strand:+ start:916 stop:1227 length:312 start_codon:yes stop_codon:yes gene_type:complete